MVIVIAIVIVVRIGIRIRIGIGIQDGIRTLHHAMVRFSLLYFNINRKPYNNNM